ncbi:MAG: ABC transporter permease [Bacteroidales bacterium]|nr:ABC transporter permease [Bacteroidales bacterium]
MNTLTLSIRTLFKKGRSNTIKVVTLGAGLAIGLALISKILFEISYDNFYPDIENIYRLESKISWNNDPPESWGQVSGAVAPGMRDEIPQVTAATRITYLSGNESTTFTTTERRRFSGVVILADSCFYDILPREMVIGEAGQILSTPMSAMISSSLYKIMGPDILGKTVQFDSYPGKEIVIGGVFRDIPENSTLKYDLVISLKSIGSFLWDGTENWTGNDRYRAFVKLAEGVDPATLAPAVIEMQKRHQDTESFKKAGVSLSYGFVKLLTYHRNSTETKRMNLLLGILAVILITAAVFNYILIVVTTLAARAREIAIYKCHGAERKEIFSLVFTETAIHLILSLVFAALLIFVFRGAAQEILSVSISSLLTPKTVSVLFGICLFILIISVIIPVRLFTNIPVATVINNFKISGRRWKIAFLSAQFFATALLLTLLVVTVKQYNLMINDKPGYAYENLLYFYSPGVTIEQKEAIINKLTSLPHIQKVASSETLPFNGQSGNNVYIPGDDRELFNIADLYAADENYIDLFEIPIIEGKPFNKEYSGRRDVMISRQFRDKLTEMAGWSDGVVGKAINITEHGSCVITGVYEDFRIGSVMYEDKRPSAMFYTSSPARNLLIKLKRVNPEGIKEVYNSITTILPEENFVLTPYKASMVKLYEKARIFRNALIIGGIITLLITLAGLIGYVKNEIFRKSQEIALRKINGAELLEILTLFIKDISKIALIPVILGIIASYFASVKILESFSQKTELTPGLLIMCGLITLAITISVVLTSTLKIAIQNPIKSLKNE